MDAIAYHAQRAAREHDLGVAAGATPAAQAHFQLASLHRERARALAGELAPASIAHVG